MDLKLKYNSEEVAEKIDFTSVIMYDRLGGMFDDIKLSLPLKEKSIIADDIQKEDVIEIQTDGYSTGEMYVDEYSIDDSNIRISAISGKPRNKEKKSRIWRNVRLSEIILDVANGQGLIAKSYGINDYTYDVISQIDETDIHMLDRICKREGYSIKIDNNNLIVFDEYMMETESKAVEIRLSDTSVRKRFSFKDGKCVHSVTVLYYGSNGIISQTAVDENCTTGTDKRIIEYVQSYDEAKRFAKGYLRNYNKNMKTGTISVDYNPKISAGTVLELSGFNENDGRYIVFEVTHDVVTEITKLKIRAVLGY